MTPVEALQPAIVLLGAGTVAALASRALTLSPMVGYIIAGIVIGPHGFAALSDDDTTHLLAELGVVFLLFDIGLHFSLREIRSSGRDMFILAPIQILICGAAFTLGALAIGCSFPIAIAIGMSFGLSSTAVVTRILSERGLNTCPLGRSSFAVLIFQDIVAIFLLIFANSLGGDPERLMTIMLVAAGQSIVAFSAAALIGHFVVRPLFRVLASAQVEEIFTMTAVLIVVAAAAATGALGLSLTLGAFLAGMAIADSPFRHSIQTEVAPFRGLLLSFFFVNVGLIIDFPTLLTNLPIVFGVTLGIILIKTVMVFIVARLSKWTMPGATQLAFLLSQASEFTLVVLSIAAVRAETPGNWISILVASTALSLAVAPLWAALGMRISLYFAELRARRGRTQAHEGEIPAINHNPQVIVFGTTEAGRITLDALGAHNIPFVALDNKPDRFISALSDGYSVIYGDSADFRLLDSLGAMQSKVLVLGENRYDVSERLTSEIQERFSNLQRFVAVDTPSDGVKHASLGMKAHIIQTQMDSIAMAAEILRTLEISEERVKAWVDTELERLERDSTSQPDATEAA